MIKDPEGRRAYQAVYYQKHKEAIQLRSMKWATEHKEQRQVYHQDYYKRNKERLQAYDRTYSQKLSRREIGHLNKVTVLSHYSNPPDIPICNHCGEQDIDVLCIDHIEGGGHQERIKLGLSGNGFYKWLGRNSYPDGYQVLCYNCNIRKYIPG